MTCLAGSISPFFDGRVNPPSRANVCPCKHIGSSTRVNSVTARIVDLSVFETRTATGSKLFSLLTCLHTTTFILLSIISPLQMISIKIWEIPLSWHAKCSLPVAVRVLKTRLLKLPQLINESMRERSLLILLLFKRWITLSTG